MKVLNISGCRFRVLVEGGGVVILGVFLGLW